ncbi:hypothetical protein MKX01_036031 [Papaver californicum]|nr:hypothetical protein MKX01_036031 [Papaver californicum]
MLPDGSIFAQSPSFNSYSSDNFAEIAAKVCQEFVDDRVQLSLEPLIKEENDDKPGEIVELQEEKDDLLQEEEEEKAAEEDIEKEEDEDEFEFSFLSGDGIAISADEIFANGQIRPVFPIFNRDLLFAGGKNYDEDNESKHPKKNSSLRKLFIGEREEDVHSCSSSEADELDNLPAGTYCVWKPKQSSTRISSSLPDTCKKSKSTGSSSSSSQSVSTTSVSKRWRFRDFLFRSNSDGKDTFVFLTPSASSSSATNKMMMKNTKEEKLVIEKLEKVVVSGEGKVVGKGKSKTGAAADNSAHEIHYVRNRALKENDRKKSYLPYRQDLVGFFANVNGLSRNLHPF